MTEPKNLILRRCKGNRNAWIVIMLRPDGQESGLGYSRVTGLSPEGAFWNALEQGLIRPDDSVTYRP